MSNGLLPLTPAILTSELLHALSAELSGYKRTLVHEKPLRPNSFVLIEDADDALTEAVQLIHVARVEFEVRDSDLLRCWNDFRQAIVQPVARRLVRRMRAAGLACDTELVVGRQELPMGFQVSQFAIDPRGGLALRLTRHFRQESLGLDTPFVVSVLFGLRNRPAFAVGRARDIETLAERDAEEAMAA